MKNLPPSVYLCLLWCWFMMAWWHGSIQCAKWCILEGDAELLVLKGGTVGASPGRATSLVLKVPCVALELEEEDREEEGGGDRGRCLCQGQERDS